MIFNILNILLIGINLSFFMRMKFRDAECLKKMNPFFENGSDIQHDDCQCRHQKHVQ